MGDLITVTKKHPLYEKKKALTEAYGYEPPSSKVEQEDYIDKSGNMYEWPKEDLEAALEASKKKAGTVATDGSDNDAKAQADEYRNILLASIGEDKDYTYDFETQEAADEFEKEYAELIKETDAEKEFNQAMWAMSDHGASWKPEDAAKTQEPVAITPQSLADSWGESPEAMPAARDLTTQEQAALLAKLKEKPAEKTDAQKRGEAFATLLKSFGSGEL